MTLETYYKSVDELKPPDGLDAFDRADWYTDKIRELQQELSAEDLNTVTQAERRWNDKQQSASA